MHAGFEHISCIGCIGEQQAKLATRPVKTHRGMKNFLQSKTFLLMRYNGEDAENIILTQAINADIILIVKW